jgi:TM2 domain-containing membrane protein YozV
MNEDLLAVFLFNIRKGEKKMYIPTMFCNVYLLLLLYIVFIVFFLPSYVCSPLGRDKYKNNIFFSTYYLTRKSFL